MNPDNLFQLGVITDTHGTKGEVHAFIDADDPKHYESVKHLFVRMKSQYIPYFISKIRIRKDGDAIIAFEDIQSIEQADLLVGAELHATIDLLPKLTGDKFYYHEITDAMIVDEFLGELGPISNVYEAPQQVLIEFMHQGKEVMFPLNDAFFKKFDREKHQFHTSLPDGLLDVYITKDPFSEN